MVTDYARKIRFAGVESVLIGVTLSDFVPFVQFKKREKHSWRSVTFSRVPIFSQQLH